MNEANITYRIAPGCWLKEDRFAGLLRELAKRRDGFDDVALFLSPTHSVRKHSVVAAEMPRLTEAMRRLEAIGIPAGIDILTVMGHHSENFPAMPEGLQLLTGPDGRTTPGTICPRTPENRTSYIAPLLKLLVSCKPRFIWFDDDIRYSFHGDVGPVCFCPNCLAAFNRKYGTAFTREELTAKFDAGTPEDQILWRKRWLAFSGESVASFFAFLEETVHREDPEIELGAMDAGMRIGDSAPMETLAAALSGPKKKPVRWRPGGGAYTDENFPEFLHKAHSLGCEAALLPDSVTNIQAEVENFNYQRLAKSKRANLLEAALYVASGVPGCAWNIMEAADPLEAYLPLMDELSAARPFLNELAQYARIRPSGIWHGWTPERFAGEGVGGTDKPWTSRLCWDMFTPHRSDLFRAGLPPAYRLEDALVTILTPECAQVLSDNELQTVFSRGVYLPAATLEVLEARGLACWAGVRVANRIRFDASEELLEHPLNGEAAGFTRDCRQSFPWGFEYGYDLEDLTGKGEKLARLVDYFGNELAACSLMLTENELGGRVATAGYYSMRNVLFHNKIQPLKRLFAHLAGSPLPALGESWHNLPLWGRFLPEGGAVAAGANFSADPAEKVLVRLAAKRGTAEFIGQNGGRATLEARQTGPQGTLFELPELAAWEAFQLVGK